jgi:hypothetical protein
MQRIARQRRLTTAAWVRQVLRGAIDEQSTPSVADKLAAVRRAARHSFPTADIDTVLGDIERGYSSREA